jgi:hypothetical protein
MLVRACLTDTCRVANGQRASGTRRWRTCCNVSQLEADRQIAGYWLPNRNNPELNREATRISLRQGSLRVGQRADPHLPGESAQQKKETPMHGFKRATSVPSSVRRCQGSYC